MSLLKSITDFLDSIFKRSSPEFQKKQLLKKLESEIKNYNPTIYKNGNLLGNFAEAIYTLYKNVRPLDNLFSTTVNPNDIPRQKRFEAQLILTGFSTENQNSINSLTFPNRKAEIINAGNNFEREYIHQHKLLEGIIKELNNDLFKKIDSDIICLRQFVEFCRFNFLALLLTFDPKFQAANSSYTPTYQEVPLTKVATLLEDYFYQAANIKLNTSIAEMILALAQLKKGSELTNEERNSLLSNIKKINAILVKVLSEDKINNLIKLAKNDSTFEPSKYKLSVSPKQEFSLFMQEKFTTDEQRIKSDLQDDKISEEVKALFGSEQLDELSGYNLSENSILQENTAESFLWILPMKILKTFLRVYLSEGVKSLLNDIVIEGFFNNPIHKSNFSSLIYAISNNDAELKAFEESFSQEKKNSISVLNGYIYDSKKNSEFLGKVKSVVLKINDEAHDILQRNITNIFSLYHELGELLADAKKPSSEIISNLKVLMISSRNKDNTNLLEQQYPEWKVFIEIMRNYVIINGGV
ncbi:MAG: hypothetical protein GX677_05510 [Treponema sp.]|jgi:hypothetical protein|nr:hypothetical protein [Treponema sp.]